MSGIPSKINSALVKVKAAISSLMVDATLTHLASSTYDTATGSTSGGPTTTSLRIIIDKYKGLELLNTNVLATDLRILAFNDGVEPTTGDSLTISGSVFTVISVNGTYLADSVAIYELQCRK